MDNTASRKSLVDLRAALAASERNPAGLRDRIVALKARIAELEAHNV